MARADPAALLLWHHRVGEEAVRPRRHAGAAEPAGDRHRHQRAVPIQPQPDVCRVHGRLCGFIAAGGRAGDAAARLRAVLFSRPESHCARRKIPHRKIRHGLYRL